MSIFKAFKLPIFTSSRSQHTSGRIISDGCRDYIVGIKLDQDTEILTNRSGQPLRFASLAAAKQTLRQANVGDIQLVTRVAADEACAGGTLKDSGFASLKLA